MNPLYIAPSPKAAGVCRLACGIGIAYELRGVGGERVILLNGAFGTLRHYDELAQALADGGYRVLAFDFRHVGASRAGPEEPVTPNQTSDLLASDALELLDQLWPGSAVHVYGASMGGFIAQKLALSLIPQGRLASLYIAASSRGLRWWPSFFNTTVFRWLLPLTIKHPVEKMTVQLVRDSFSKAYLESVSDDPAAEGATMRELWHRRWTADYAKLFAFCDVEACAGQAPLAMRHRLSDDQASQIAGCGKPVTMYVAGRDAMITPADQRTLGQLLGARVLDTNSAHMEAHMAGLIEFPKHLELAKNGAVSSVDT